MNMCEYIKNIYLIFNKDYFVDTFKKIHVFDENKIDFYAEIISEA